MATSALEQVFIDAISKSTAVSGEIYDGIKTVGSKAIDLAQKEIPDIVEQLLMWKMTEAIVGLVMYFVIFGILLYLLIRWWKTPEKPSDEMQFLRAMGTGLFALALCFSAISPFNDIMTIVKISVAPKIYLIEYANDLVRRNIK